MNKNKEIKTLVSILEIIPGIKGFAPILNIDDNTTKDNSFIILEEENNNLEISIGLIVNRNVLIKSIVREIKENIDNLYIKKTEFKLSKINIYIKGVK